MRTLAQRAAVARVLNDSKLFGLRASSETLHLFTEEQIARAQALAVKSIDRRTKPSRKGKRRGH